MEICCLEDLWGSLEGLYYTQYYRLYYRLCTADSVLQTLHYRLQYRLQTTDSVGRAEGLLLAVLEASSISVGQFRRWNLTEMAKKWLGGSVRVCREG
jgi:hypothetical protein